MRSIVFTLISLMITPVYAEKIKVAVIDTGFAGHYATPESRKSLCANGHYDFTTKTPNVGYDLMGHGTFVTNLVIEEAKLKNMCILVYKAIGGFYPTGIEVVRKALIKAYYAGAKVVNISLGHYQYSEKEKRTIKYLTDRGMKIFVSAGNDSRDTNRTCRGYPVCYKGLNGNFYRVGATDSHGMLENYSNRGLKIDLYEYGEIIGVGNGTSFASPRAAGKYLREKYGKR